MWASTEVEAACERAELAIVTVEAARAASCRKRRRLMGVMSGQEYLKKTVSGNIAIRSGVVKFAIRDQD